MNTACENWICVVTTFAQKTYAVLKENPALVKKEIRTYLEHMREYEPELVDHLYGRALSEPVSHLSIQEILSAKGRGGCPQWEIRLSLGDTKVFLWLEEGGGETNVRASLPHSRKRNAPELVSSH